MTINTERLKTDAAYWDECGAQKDTTHYCPVAKLFYNDSYPIANCCIPRPTKPAAPEWNGEGLPPAGCECEIEMQVADQDSGVYLDPWRWCEILAHRDDCAIVWVPSVNKALKVCNRAAFRPIRTKEQRERDDLLEILCMDEPLEVRADAILSRYNLEPKQ